MKYMEITEGIKKPLKLEEAANRIKRASYQWLVESNYRPAYRGIATFSEDGVAFHTQSRNFTGGRGSVDSSPAMQDAWNALIAKKGFIANRDNSIFVTGERSMATNYGHAFVIYPIGDYDYTWHVDIQDGYRVELEMNEYINDSINKFYGFDIDKIGHNIEKDYDYQNSAEATFRYGDKSQIWKNELIYRAFSEGMKNTGLEKALASEHEIYLRAASYVAVSSEYLNELLDLIL